LAPYSQFQNITFNPPIVMFSANQTTQGMRKDSVRNAEDTGEFVWNMATYDLRHAVNLTAEELPHGVDEFEHAKLQNVLKMKPLARMGYYDYTYVDNKFEMIIGGDNKALLAGLEGSPDKAKTAFGS